MPELPDLLYIQKHLQHIVLNKPVAGVLVKKPIVIRNASPCSFEDALRGSQIRAVEVRAPFLRFQLDNGLELILNLMLAGRLQVQGPRAKALGHLCVSIVFEDAARLNICDDQLMAKAYLVPSGAYGTIPGFENPGIDILSPAFTLDAFRALVARHSRKQVRVLINDHTILMSIGNAYADEILFEACIHPKTFARRLSPPEVERLYQAIGTVMRWGVMKVEEAAQPIEVKVRDHMKVRNRHGEPCPRCGTTIRREGVRGYDVFFCPRCQPATRSVFIDWK